MTYLDNCQTVELKSICSILISSIFHLHVVHEQGMIGSCRDNLNFDSMLGIPVEELVIHKYLVSFRWHIRIYEELHQTLDVHVYLIQRGEVLIDQTSNNFLPQMKMK